MAKQSGLFTSEKLLKEIPIYLLDEECHKALGNTILLKKAGIINEDGTAGKTTLRGDGAGGGLKLFDFLKKCVDGFRGGPSTFFPSF